MSPWVAIYQQHAALRAGHSNTLQRLQAPLRRLAALRTHCDPSLPWYLRSSKEGGRISVYIQPHKSPKGPVPLTNLPDLTNARMSIQATIVSTTNRLSQFSAAISGETSGGVDWTVAIHLENDLQPPASEGWNRDWRGGGACGHAIYHCHVGPDLDAKPKVRVPFLAVGPEHALDWLLTTVVPGFEPMPWPEVSAILAARPNP